MDRRLLLASLALWPAACLRAQDEAPRPRHKISAGELHEAMSARFPVRFGMAGLLEVRISAPQLLLLPARNRLGATLLAQAAGLQLPRPELGEIDLVFAVRYEPADRTLRAHRLELIDLRWPSLPPETARALQGLLPRMTRDAVGEFVLHRFTQRQLALPDTMGFEPDTITVVDDGLLIQFGPKPLR